MPSLHGVVGDRKLGFWTEDLLPMAPIVLLGSIGFVRRVRSEAGAALYLAAVGSGGLIASYLSRMHVGGFDNVMMYGFAGGCVLAGVAAANPAKSLRTAAPALLLAQFAWLGYAAYARGAATLFPSAAHARAHDQLRDVVRAQDGPVWIPGHGHIAYREGKGTGAHGQAIFDILILAPKLPNGMIDRAALTDPAKLTHLPKRAQLAIQKMMEQCTRALAERSFSAVIIDEDGANEFTVLFAAGLVGADELLGTDDDPYSRAAGYAVKDPGAIRPLVGRVMHSPYVIQRRPQ